MLSMYDAALIDFTRSLELNPNDTWVRERRGDCYRQLHKCESALLDMNQVLQLNPNDLWALNSRGKCYREMNKNVAALQDWNQCMTIDPNDVAVLNNRVDFYVDMQRYNEAIADINKIKPAAMEAWHFRDRGECYFFKQQYEEALNDFHASIKLDADPWAVRRCGECYTYLKRYTEAIAEYNKSLQLEEDAFAYRKLGYIYCLLGNFQSALENIEKALVLEPSHQIAITLKGDCQFGMQQFELAIEIYTKSLALNPKQPVVLRKRGQSYCHANKLNDGLNDFNTSLSLEKTASGFADRAECHMLLANYQAVFDDCATSLKLDPHFDMPHQVLAETYRQLGQHDKAVREINLALKQSPNSRTSLLIRALCFLPLKEYAAFHDLQQLKSLLPPPQETYLAKNIPQLLAMVAKQFDEKLQFHQ